MSLMNRKLATALLAVVAPGLLPGGVSRGAETPSVRKERLEYDSATGQWVAAEPPVPGTPEGDLRLARADFVAGKHRSADRRVKKWIKTHGETHVLYPQAALLRAEVEIARRNYYKAHKHLQEFLNEFGASPYAERALELEFVIAEVFLSGTRRKLLGVRILPAQDTGVAILDDLWANYSETQIAESAIKTKADHYFRTGDFASAEMEYAALVKDFPRSRYVRQALRRSAESALASFPGVEYDDAALIEAEERYRNYVATYPDTAEQEGIGLILEDIASQRAAKEYEIGRYYERTGHRRAAEFYYRSTIENWPDTIAATRARDRLRSLGVPEKTPEPAPSPDATVALPVGEGATP